MVIKNASQIKEYFELKEKLEYLKTLQKSKEIHIKETKREGKSK